MAFLRSLPLLLLLLALASSTAPLQAQSLKQVVESLAPTGKPAAAPAKKEPAASEQIPWVDERIQEAKQRADTLRSEGFIAKFQSAGFPESRSLEMSREAAEAIDGWMASRNLLDWIAARESVAAVPKPTPSIPATTPEALVLDREYDDLKTQLARLAFDSANQAEAATRAEEQSRSAKRELAQLRLDAEGSLPAAARDRSDVQILYATIREDAARAQLFLQRWLSYRLRLEADEHRTRADLIAQILEDSGYSRLLSTPRASTEIARIQATLPDLEKDEQAISAHFDKASASLAASRSLLKAATANGSAPADLQKQVATDLAEFSRHESLLVSTRFQSFLLRQTLALWSRVLELVNDPSLEKLRQARRDLAEQQPSTRTLADRLNRILAEKENESDKARQDLRMPGLTSSHRTSLQDDIKKNRAIIEKFLEVRNEVDSLQTLQNRLLQEIDTEIDALVNANRLAATLSTLRTRFLGVWNFTLGEQGDRVLTLGTILTALLAFIASLAIARFSARRLATTLGHRFSLPGSSAHLLEKLTLYGLSLVFILMILQWLQIPLTLFAFLGGALAVGIGFGSQNLINNFISGLLLLIEQKIKVGDLVQVDGNFGRVTDLGSRCSSIRKFDGVEILVPNSALLEKNVVNWTLSNPDHRFDFTVGVAYGSDVELVQQTLQQALEDQPEIFRDPAPEVVFESFGDSALIFHVYYWLKLGTHSTRQIGSQLHFRIDRLFRDRRIVMAFPQRDIHLIPTTPIPIRLEKK
jgi:potassium-dependent mechanosensitive channel